MRIGGEAASLAGPRLLLLCNLLLAVIAAGVVWSYDRAGAEQRLLRLVDRTNDDLQAELDLTVALLRGTTGFFEASDEVSAAEFRRYVETLDLRLRHPSLLGIGYARRVGPHDVDALERYIRRNTGDTGFRVWPRPTTDMDTSIVFLEPRDRGNELAIGFDMMSEPVRRRAMEDARDSGDAVASGIVTLVQEAAGQGAGVNIYIPHYRPGEPVDTVEARRAALVGYVYSPIRVREVFGGHGQVPGDLHIRVYDGTDLATARLIHEEPPGQSYPHPYERQLLVAGRTWTVRYGATTPPPMVTPPAAGVLAAGFLLAGLLYRIQCIQFRARARAERDAAALQVGERRYRSLAAAVPQVVFTADAEGRLAYTNGRWPSGLLGEPVARSLLACVHDEDRVGCLGSWEAALAAGTPWSASFRTRCTDADGWRWHLGNALPQQVEGRIVEWVGTLTDIQAQKEAEEALLRQAGELERRVAERTAELERSVRELENFVAVASHDLQEPLRKIVAFGDRLSDELGDDIPPAAADALTRMRRAAQRLQQLISDLLTFARVSRAEVVARPVDLEYIVREVVAELTEGRPDGAVVEIADIPAARGDPTLLRQLVVNLVGNALKFHRPEEAPRVRVSSEPAGEEVEESQRGRWFRLLVEDEGIGFDPKYLHRIFQVFQRLHPRDRYEGTGIGLAICQRVVELHGGTITARSRPSHGACFVVTLPRAVPATTQEECMPPRDEAQSSSQRTTPTTVS